MKIEIIIGSGVGLFAESDEQDTRETKTREAPVRDQRWQAILPPPAQLNVQPSWQRPSAVKR